MSDNRFLRDGFAPIPHVLTAVECEALCAALSPLATTSPGTRNLLAQDWCAALACRLRTHPAVAAAIPDDFAAVQCTYFEKLREQNITELAGAGALGPEHSYTRAYGAPGAAWLVGKRRKCFRAATGGRA